MRIQIFCKKTASELPQNVNIIFQYIRKNFSVLNTSRKRAKSGDRKVNSIVFHGEECERKPSILKPNCNIALIIGGLNNGFGFSAADQLLHHRAKKVIMADTDLKIGNSAAAKLCKAHGKDRAKFYLCDITNSNQIKGIFKSAYCRDEQISILFNDIDAIQNVGDCDYKNIVKFNKTLSITRIGFEFMSCKKNEKQDINGIIINCASILGFVGWPDQPEPIYCGKDPTIQTTIDITKSYITEKTGIRVISLCPTNRAFNSIGLPEFPDKTLGKAIWPNYQSFSCIPDPMKDRNRIGKALVHIMAYAKNGTVWLLEPPYSLSEIPKLVDFPEMNEA